MKNYSLDELSAFAKNFEITADLPIRYDCEPYTRTSLFKDDVLEIVVICLGKGQTSSVHDHQGSNCVVRVISGTILELLFDEENDLLTLRSNKTLSSGDVSGLDGVQVHQLSNLDNKGSVLLNFYSPPFQV